MFALKQSRNSVASLLHVFSGKSKTNIKEYRIFLN